jgi:hypothetical protein
MHGSTAYVAHKIFGYSRIQISECFLTNTNLTVVLIQCSYELSLRTFVGMVLLNSYENEMKDQG